MSRQHKRRFPAMPCIDLALSESVIRNDVAEVRRALQAGAFVNGLDREGLGAIHQAIYENNFDILRLLVRHGADVRLRDSESWTPLHTVAQTGNCEMARFLVKEGANTDAVDGEGLFPIDRAERSDMRSLLYKAMKRAGHVQLSNQYRTYLEQELILEGSLGDTDSLCSSVSAYSLSLSEDEGQFSQSDGDELHGILMQDDAEEKIDTLSPCATTTQLVPASEQKPSRMLGEKTEPRNDSLELSLRSRNDSVKNEEAACCLVKVKAFVSAPGLKSVEFTVDKDVMYTPEVNVVFLGILPPNKETLCKRKLGTDSNEETAEMSHVGSVGEIGTRTPAGVDAEYPGYVQQEGSLVCRYQLPSTAGQETAAGLPSVPLGGSHLVGQQLGADKQEIDSETGGDNFVVRKAMPPEVALSRSELRNARAAFFSSPQPRHRRTPVKDKSRSTSPATRRRAQSVRTVDFTRLAREESPRDSSSSSSFILEEAAKEKDTGRMEDREHCRSRSLDSVVGMSQHVDTKVLKSGDIAQKGVKENDLTIQGEDETSELGMEGNKNRSLSLVMDAVQAEQTNFCNVQLNIVEKTHKANNIPAVAIGTEQVDVEVIPLIAKEGDKEEATSSPWEVMRSEQLKGDDLQLAVDQDVGENLEDCHANGLTERERCNSMSPVAQENDTHCTVQSKPGKISQSFGWESSEDDSSCEETVVFFRVDESGTCVRNGSDDTSGNSLFSPDSDPPLMPLQSSADPDELLSVSSDSSCGSAYKEQNQDKVLLGDLSRKSQPCNSNVVTSVEQENECLALPSDRQMKGVGGHISDSDDDGCHTVQKVARVRASPPRPRSLRFSVDNTVTLRRSEPLKSSMKQTSLRNLHVCPAPQPSVYRRSVTFDPVVCFQDAIVVGDVEEVMSLIKAKRVDLDGMTPQGYAVLHAAAIEGTIECIRMLVGSGANVNIQDEDGWTPLHAAASHGYLDIVQYLLRSGADPCIVGNNGETAYEVVDEDSDPVMEQILKDAMGDQFEVLVGSRLCQNGDEGKYSEDGDDEESDEEEALSPQDDGDESNVETVFQTSRLTHAADIGRWSSHSSKSSASDPGDDLTVTTCDNKDDTDATAEPLQQGLDKDNRRAAGSQCEQPVIRGPLGLAMQTNGADNSESEKMEYLGHSSTRPHRGVLVRQLRVSTTSGMETADALSSPKTVSFPPHVLLQQTVSDGDVGEVEKLLTQFTPDQLLINSVLLPSGGSLLQQSVNTENLAIVKLLIEKGSADPSIQDTDGWTPLHNAAAVGNCPIARYLISCGAKVSVLTAEGQFPSDIADNPEMVSLLRNAMLGRFWGSSFNKGSL